MKSTRQKNELREKLDYHYRYFDRTKISPDPLEFPHKYSDPLDIEISAYISSIFAYGNVRQIINTLDRLQNIIGNSPYKFVLAYDKKIKVNPFENIKHRFYSGNDIHKLFIGLNKVYKEHGSLKNLFLEETGEDFVMSSLISNFSRKMIKLCSANAQAARGLIFMFPDPEKGSACKRMNLFLRWMVRKDELDFGLWSEIPASKLIIPVDVHVARVCAKLKLTTRKNVSWKMAEEITDKLRKFDPQDPVKYDFAICHIGMRKMTF